MKKAELKKLMFEHCIVECELDDVIHFVNELLELKAKELKETEPYATVSIRELMAAAYEVWNLEEYIEEAMQDEEEEE